MDLERYIKEQLEAGYSPKEIKKSLVSVGYDEEKINDILNRYKSKDKLMKLEYIIPIILAICIVGVFYYYNYYAPTPPVERKVRVLGSPEKGIISKNPYLTEFYFNFSACCEATLGKLNPEIMILPGWEGNFIYDPGIPSTLGQPAYGKGESAAIVGIASLHPISIDKPRFMTQRISLPAGKELLLKVGIANLARYYGEPYEPGGCYDNIMVIKISAIRESEIIYNESINTNEGWKDLEFDISKYAGKNISITVEGHAGGPCGNWNGEFGAVDYLYVKEK